MSSDLFACATDPRQYDSNEINWGIETGLESPLRRFLFDCLKRYKMKWKGASILDVGCGTAWLVELFLENGAAHAEGIEPSKKNVLLAKKLRPKVLVRNKSLESFSTKRKFDLIVAAMVMCHIANVPKAFKKISSLMNEGAEFHMIVPDYEFGKTPRFDHKMRIKKINGNEYAVETIRHFSGKMFDVIRKTAVYEEAAAKSGLVLLEEVPLHPTQALIRSMPRYKEFRNTVNARLLRFKKIRAEKK